MALGKPDPRYTHGKKAQANFRLAVKVALFFLAALWLVFILDSLLGLNLNRFGLRIGRPSLHFGASGLIYGLLAYVFLSGILRRDMRSVSVSLLIGFLYGSMVWGVLPIRPHMSWELHLAGALIGILLAFVYRRWDRIPVIRYEWEEDDSLPEWYPDEPPETPRLSDDRP
jgi:membrane associated rhomboid family serine protease